MAALRPTAAMPRGARGFTLIETLVAMVLMLLALALAAQLLLEAQRTYVLAGREARRPLVGYALAQLRKDIRGSARVETSTPVPGLPGTPLVLVGATEVIRWQQEGDELVRAVTTATGRKGRRTVLRGLTWWRWQPLAPGLVSVELGVRRTLAPAMAVPGRLGPEAWREERLSLTLAQRGRTRRNRW